MPVRLVFVIGVVVVAFIVSVDLVVYVVFMLPVFVWLALVVVWFMLLRFVRVLCASVVLGCVCCCRCSFVYLFLGSFVIELYKISNLN